MDDAADRLFQMDRTAHFLDALGHAFVHAAGAADGVGKLIDQSFMLMLADAEGRLDRLAQREFLDALGGEVGVERVARNAPQLLAVGLEEHIEQTPAEATDHPRFKSFLARGVAGGMNLFFEIATQTANSIHERPYSRARSPAAADNRKSAAGSRCV